MASTSTEIIWLHRLLSDILIFHFELTLIHCEHKSAIQIAHNSVFH